MKYEILIFVTYDIENGFNASVIIHRLLKLRTLVLKEYANH